MSECEIAAQRYRVGYALEPKKIESFVKQSLLDYANQHGIDLVQIDPTTPLEEQGPFNCIIHKLQTQTQQWNKHLNEFSAKHPNTVIIDPPELVDRLHNRASMLEAVTQLQNITVGVPKQVVVNEPKAFNFDKIEELGLRFPLIAKPLVADGTAGSHKLCLVFDRDGLNALVDGSVVLQEFVNHGGVVFKIYVAGQHVNCVKRKSLGDISEEELRTLKGLVPFSRVSNLSVQDEQVEKAEMPPQSFIGELARALKDALGLNLFNVDVIRDCKDRGSYFVIDINYFPGYAKIPSYEPFITNFLLDVVLSKTQ